MDSVFPSTKAEVDEIEIRTNLTVQLCKFSKEVSDMNATYKYVPDEEYRIKFLCTLLSPVYTNNSRNSEYVQFDIKASFIHIKHYPDYCIKRLDCFVSVIDNAGNKRFTRSFSEYWEEEYHKEIALWEDEYISRETLLNEPTELLPNDILTIDVDIVLHVYGLGKRHYQDYLNAMIDNRNHRRMYSPYAKIPNTELAKTLCEVSTVFQDMFALTTEDDSEILGIPEDDTRILTFICNIVRRKKYRACFGEIFSLLKISDKYDILNMPEVCRQIIKEYVCSTERLRSPKRYSSVFLKMLIQKAKDCRDTTVLELVEAFVESIDPNFWGRHILVDRENNWEKKKFFYLLIELTYEQRLGFQFTWVSGDPEKDHDYSYLN